MTIPYKIKASSSIVIGREIRHSTHQNLKKEIQTLKRILILIKETIPFLMKKQRNTKALPNFIKQLMNQFTLTKMSQEKLFH